MDPNVFKHPAVILAKIRDAIAPSLAAAGYALDGRNKPSKPAHLYIDYSRGDDIFRLSWDRRESNQFIGLVAEFTREPDLLETVVKKDLSYIAKLPRGEKTTAEIQMQIDTIAESINNYLNALPY